MGFGSRIDKGVIYQGQLELWAGGGLITLIRDNIIFTTTDIFSTINTHNTELQMVKVHINNTKHIRITNIYIPPQDSTSQTYHIQSSPEM